MKSIILIVLLSASNLFAVDVTTAVKTIQVMDVNNEQLSGVKVEVLGTNLVYYTNINGECTIPVHVLENSAGLKIESVSYQTTKIEKNQLNSKIILAFR